MRKAEKAFETLAKVLPTSAMKYDEATIVSAAAAAAACLLFLWQGAYLL